MGKPEPKPQRTAGFAEMVLPLVQGDADLKAVRIADLQRKLKLATDALRPFALFAERWEKNPIGGLADALYSIHMGGGNEDIEASLRLSDCMKAVTALAEIEKEGAN